MLSVVWRRRLREAFLWLVLAGILVAFGGFVFMTRSPDHPAFAWLAERPLVGPILDEARRPYLRRDRATAVRRAGGARAPASGDASSQGDGSPEFDTEWIGIGARIHSSPDGGAVLDVTQRLANYRVHSRQDPWIEIERFDGSRGWVDRSRPRDMTPPLGNAPEPPGPLRARPADPARLNLARDAMGPSARRLEIAGYEIWTDVEGRERLFGGLQVRLERAEGDYEALYGQRPVGKPAESLVLLARIEDYLSMQEQVRGLEGIRGSLGHAAGGLAVAAVGRRPRGEVESTVMHEVGHLLNRRALGPSLPAWLSEGLAEHFSGLGPALLRGERVERAARFRRVEGSMALYSGPRAGLRLLAERAQVGRLPDLRDLLEMDSDAFVRGPEAPIRYAAASFFIDFLLSEEALRDRFRAFLGDVAGGGDVDAAALASRLDRDWSFLDLQFNQWLVALDVEAGA